MTLKPCSECGHNVSSTAKKCPSCGADTPLTQTSNAIGCVVGLFALIAIGWPLVSLISSCDSITSSSSSMTHATPARLDKRAVEAKEEVAMRRWRLAMNADLDEHLFVESSVSDCSGGETYCGTANVILNGDAWDALSPQSQNILFRKAVRGFESAFTVTHPRIGGKTVGIWVNFRDLSGATIKSCGFFGCRMIR